MEGEAHLRSALERAQRSGSADDVARAYINLGELLRLRGDHAGALQVMIEGDAFATGVGMRGSFGQFMFVNGADDLLRLGRWDDVRERLGRAERMSLGLTSEAMHRAIAAQLHALRGDVAAARQELDRGIAIADGLPSEFVTPIRTAGAVLALVERDPAGARRHVDAGLADLAAMDPLYTPPLLTSGIRAEADLADLGRAQRRPADADEALWRARRLAADTDRIVAARPRRSAGRARTPGARPRRGGTRQLGSPRWSAGLKRQGGSSTSESRIRLPTLSCARPRHCWPRAASAARRRGCSPPPTGRRAPFGAEPLLAEIAGLARRARLKLVAHAEGLTDVDGGRAGLTRREEEVLRLLADGLTNREIGRRLFITPEDRRHARRTHLPETGRAHEARGGRPRPAARRPRALALTPPWCTATSTFGDARYPLLAPPGGTPGRES